jgi:hypothetical protein
MDTHRDGRLEETAGESPAERDAQRALDAASSEPRTLAPEEQPQRATKLDEQATADQTAGRRTDPTPTRE